MVVCEPAMVPVNKQWITKMDGLDKLQLVDGEIPTPKEGEVLVKIQAVSLNYRDVEVCKGEFTYQASLSQSTTGIAPCSDMCGRVVESKSPLFAPGAWVMSVFLQTHLSGPVKEADLQSGLGFPLQGVLMEYRCFDAKAVVGVPGYLSPEEASCLPVASVTAWEALRPALKPGNEEEERKERGGTVLLQGTGEVSIAGLQIAKAAGLNAIITSSSDEKLKRAREELGADHGINYRTHWEWQEEVMKATGGNGADVILEVGGAKTLRKSFASVAFGGLINCIGYLSGKEDEEAEGNGERLNVNVSALRRNVTLRGLLNGGKDRFEEMVKFYEEQEIRPVVCKTFGMEEAREAMEYLEGGRHFGKVVIKVSRG